MKKIVFVFLLLIISAVNYSFFYDTEILNANAADEVISGILYADEIYADSSRYVVLDSPSNIVYGNNTIVIIDGQSIIFKGLYNGKIDNFTYFRIEEMHIYNKYLFVIYLTSSNSAPSLSLFNMETQESEISQTGVLKFSNKFPYSIDLDESNSLIYALFDSYVISYPVSIVNNLLVIDAAQGTYETNSSLNNLYYDIIYSENKTYLFNKEATTCYIDALDLSTSTITNLIDLSNDISVSASIYLNNFKDGFILSYILSSDITKQVIRLITKDGTGNITINQNYDGIAVNGDFIYLSDKKNHIVKEYTVNSNVLSLSNTYGYKGDAKTLLSNPISVVEYNNDLYIADKDNKRIVIYDYNDENLLENINLIPLPESVIPQKIIVNSNGIYIIDNSVSVYLYSFNKELTETYTLPSPVWDITISGDNTVYALCGATLLDAKEIYKKENNSALFSLHLTLENSCSFINVSDKGNSLYTVSNSLINIYNKDATPMSFNITFTDNITIKGFTTDYQGNLIIMFVKDNVLILNRYRRNINTYTLTHSYELRSRIFDIKNSNGLFINSNGDLRTVNADYNISYNIKTLNTVPVFTDKTDNYNHPVDFLASAKIVLSSSPAILYIRPDNFEDIIDIKANELFVVLNESVNENGIEYYYVQYNQNTRGYISKSVLTVVETIDSPYSTAQVMHRQAEVYSLPIENQIFLTNIIDNKDATITVNNKIGYVNDDNDLGFVSISYTDLNGNTINGYVRSYQLGEKLVLNYKTTEPVYIKVKTSRVGTKVAVYTDADSNSTIVTTLKDGTKVTLLDGGNDTYTHISYNGVEGYVLSSSVYSKGMTNSQVVALILIIVAIVIGVIFFFLRNKFKIDNNDNNKNNNDNNFLNFNF